jgi:hypothetical protein
MGEGWSFNLITPNDNAAIITPITSVTVPQDNSGSWNKTFGVQEEAIGFSVQQTQDSGYIILGSVGNQSVNKPWLIKTDADGNKLWDKILSESSNSLWGPRSIQQTSDVGYILAGDIDPERTFQRDGQLIKTDSNGNILWEKNYDGSWRDNSSFWGDGATFESVQQTNDLGYIVLGSQDITYIVSLIKNRSISYGGGCDIWLKKTDEDGNTLWDRTFGGSDANFNFGQSVSQTSDGGYIITGTKGEDFENDLWLIKTDAYGNDQWNKTFISGVGNSVQQTKDGGYIIAGYQSGNMRDVWLIKTDVNGNMLWNKTFGIIDNGLSISEEGYSVQQTSDGGYIILGKSDANRGDIWLIKTDSNGNKQWDRTIGGSDFDRGYSVQQTKDGGYVIAGETQIAGDRNSVVWLIKTDANGN